MPTDTATITSTLHNRSRLRIDSHSSWRPAADGPLGFRLAKGHIAELFFICLLIFFRTENISLPNSDCHNPPLSVDIIGRLHCRQNKPL